MINIFVRMFASLWILLSLLKYLMTLLACLNKLLVLYLFPPNLILLLTISHWTVLFADSVLIVTDIVLRAGKDNALLVEWRIQDSLL